jgi:hypothetical protein
VTDALESRRLLTFEIGGTLYGLPIHAVAEISEVGRIAAVPTLHADVAGVTNHHGDALPVMRRRALLPVEGDLPAAQQLLVLADHPEDPGRYGLPVDGVVGLVDGPGSVALSDDPVAERRPIDGRVVSILDPKRLRARAVEIIEGTTGPDGLADPGR